MTTLLDKTTKSGLVTLIVGLSLLIPASIGLLLAGAPSVVSPIPMLTAIPAISLFGGAAVLIPTLFFFVWNPGLFRGEENVPKRSYGLLATATAFSIIWFVGDGWKYGLQYQGSQYTHLVCAINFVWVASLWALVIYDWKRAPSFGANLLFHWIVFVWLSWYAFPWLGELP